MNKKLPIIMFFAVVLCCGAHAQFVSMHVEDPTNPGGTQTIVRSWNSNYAVSYYVDANYNPTMDVIEQSSGNIQRSILPNDVFIRDMYIDQATDMLYFCGATTFYIGSGPYTGNGIIGWIDLNTFFYPNMSMGYIYLNALVNSQKSVNKLVEYDDGGVPHIIALAEQRQYVGQVLQSSYYYLSSLDIAGPNPSLYIGGFSNDERYDDVLLTDNYVVFVGYDSNPTINSLCYRKADPWNFPDNNFYDIHYFTNGNDPLSPTLSSTLYKDFIATSYLALGYHGDTVTRIRLLDIDTDVNIRSQEYIVTNCNRPDGMAFIPADNSLVLMQEFLSPNGYRNTNFVSIDPFMYSPYTTDIEFKKLTHFHSLTMHDTYYYLAGFGSSWFLRDKTLSPTNFPDSDCPITDNIIVKTIDKLIPYYTTYYVWYFPTYATRISTNQLVVNSSVNVICFNLP